MSIKFSDYKLIKKCSGNSTNKIYIVKNKNTQQMNVIKIIALDKQQR